MTTIRCKFKCTEVTKREGWGGSPFLYSAAFTPVTSGSDENKKFWEATPSGLLSVGTVKESAFEVGKEYYLDITAAEAVNNV